MPRMTQSEYELYLSKCRQVAATNFPTPPSAGVERESKLHEQILAYCAQKQWVCVHSRLDRPTTQQRGVTDFIIANPRGTFWVEAKAKGKKLRPEQLAFKCLVEHNKHQWAVVYSMEDFRKVIE